MDKITSFYNEWLQEIYRKAAVEIKKAQEKAWVDSCNIIAKDLKDIYNRIIDDYYNNYDPTIYTREKDPPLYNMLKFNITNESFSMYFDESLMTYRSGIESSDDENSLYDIVFRKGYHGGAYIERFDNVVVPYTHVPELYDGDPVEYLLYDGDERPYDCKPTKWRIAPKDDISPLDRFKNESRDYFNSPTYYSIYNNLYKKYMNEIRL